MTQKPDGGPAYPAIESITGATDGMSLRDYFAGQALTGYFSGALVEEGNPSGVVARQCYMMADAMIAARGETQ